MSDYVTAMGRVQELQAEIERLRAENAELLSDLERTARERDLAMAELDASERELNG